MNILILRYTHIPPILWSSRLLQAQPTPPSYSLVILQNSYFYVYCSLPSLMNPKTLKKALHFLQTVFSVSTSCLADSLQSMVVWMEIEENNSNKISYSKGHKELSLITRQNIHFLYSYFKRPSRQKNLIIFIRNTFLGKIALVENSLSQEILRKFCRKDV